MQLLLEHHRASLLANGTGRAEAALDVGAEGDGLAPVGVGAGRGARAVAVGEVLRHDAQPRGLRLEARGRDGEGVVEVHPFWFSSGWDYCERPRAVRNRPRYRLC